MRDHKAKQQDFHADFPANTKRRKPATAFIVLQKGNKVCCAPARPPARPRTR
jgi:hypothetical protein